MLADTPRRGCVASGDPVGWSCDWGGADRGTVDREGKTADERGTCRGSGVREGHGD